MVVVGNGLLVSLPSQYHFTFLDYKMDVGHLDGAPSLLSTPNRQFVFRVATFA